MATLSRLRAAVHAKQLAEPRRVDFALDLRGQDFEDRAGRHGRAATARVALGYRRGKHSLKLGEIVAFGAHVGKMSSGNLAGLHARTRRAIGERQQSADCAEPKAQRAGAPDEAQMLDVLGLIGTAVTGGAGRLRDQAELVRSIEWSQCLHRSGVTVPRWQGLAKP